MLLVKAHCSGCPEEVEVVVDDLDEVDREVCSCGHNVVVLSVAEFIPVHSPSGEVVRLELPGALRRAA